MVSAIGQAHQLQGRLNLAASLGLRQGRQQEGQFNILKGRVHRDEIEALKDEAHVLVAPVGQFRLVQTGHVDALNFHGPARGGIDARQDVQQRRFTRT